MSKFLTRITILIVAIYFLASYFVAFFWGVDIFRYTYILLFELCVVCYTFLNGKYHCKYIRWTAASILVCDSLSHADYYFNFLSVNELFFSSIVVLSSGMMASTISAVRHFLRVNKAKQMRKKSGHNHDNNERNTNVGNQDS